MKNYKYYVVLLFLFSGLHQVLAQSEFVRPTAHYPLEAYDKHPTVNYARYLLIRPWDVSGNARHGTIRGINTFNQTSKKYEGFEAGHWIEEDQNIITVGTTRPCLKKSHENRARNSNISLPSPFGFSDINQTGFTVSFWYNPGDFRDDTIITTKKFSIDISEANNIRLIHRNADGHDVQFSHDIARGSCLPNSWTFICFTYDASSNRVNSYQQGYSSHETMKTNTPYEIVGAYDIIFPSDRYSVDQICGVSFSGEVSNVRFYDTPLSPAQVNNVKNTDLDWNVGTYNSESFIEKGAFMKYDFDEGSMHESINGLDGASYGTVSATTNRFAHPNKAIHFSGTNAYIETPSFFSASMPVIDYNPSVGGITFSFWVKTDAAHEFPTDPNELQDLHDNFDHSTKKIFYANNAQNDELFGMQRFKGALGQIRYTQNAQNQLQSWFFWLYDRVAFARQGDKWYHVIYVQHPNWQRMYVAKKEDPLNCFCEETDINCWEHCRCAYNYQGIQDLSDATNFGFGNNQGQPIANLDDVSVYHWPLSPDEVGYLHDAESTDPLTYPTQRMLDSKHKMDTSDTETSLLLFPNPSSDFINIKSSKNISSATISSIFGQVFKYPVVNNSIDIRDLAEGIYFLRVSINDTTETIKFIKK
jgi:hypothetical protein